MALVMLPCDLPWWGSVQKQLSKISATKNTLELIEGMQKIHDMCSVSLDPDEDTPDPQQFTGLLNFLDNDLTSAERSTFLNKTLPSIATRATNLRYHRPKRGLHFSLQQQPDSTELEYDLVSSLLANAFFSTFPKRTDKTHPTLRDFNFSNFFKHLGSNWQKAKLKSILYYFDWLDVKQNSNGHITILRQVMSSKEWLTIEDWLECSLPLCSLQIKHEGRLERAPRDSLHVSFATTKIGNNVLEGGNSQECMNLSCIPELLCVLLNVEALEDNEVLTVENVRRVSRIADPQNRATIETAETPETITVTCVDAEDYSKLPLTQYEEDNILRELNKCLLAYQQKQSVKNVETQPQRGRRLSPIGESVSLGSNQDVPLITQQSCSTRSGSESPKLDNNNLPDNNLLKVKLGFEMMPPPRESKYTTNEAILNNRRGRFIVLGSSGECLPVKRRPVEHPESLYSSCESSEEEFHSARTSVDDGSEEEDYHKRYSLDLETAERRQTFAERLREALRREASSMSTSSESSYAVGIAVAGSGLSDADISVRRKGSTGFMLQEDSLDEAFLRDSLKQEKQWINKFKTKQTALNRKESSKSSEYSFSTDYSSELEEVYEQFSRWLEDPILETDGGPKRKLDARDLAVVQFAGSILKRTLSESFAGVPLTDGCENLTGTNVNDFAGTKRNKMVLNAKSLSLELARHKHRLAAQLSLSTVPFIEEEEEANNDECNDETLIDKVDNHKSSSGTANKNRLNWVATCVEDVIQTLEEICVNVNLPLTSFNNNEKLSQIAQKPKNGLKPVSTGNWGCGSTKKGEVQLKVVIQWLAASVSGVPALIYYTNGHQELAMLDTLCRILRDRKWTVKDLAEATLRYSTQIIDGRNDEVTLFEDLIGVAKNC